MVKIATSEGVVFKGRIEYSKIFSKKLRMMSNTELYLPPNYCHTNIL
jgi:hypothetical protein